VATEQVYFDDVEPGDDISPVTKAPTREQIKAYLGVGGEIQPGSYRFFDDAAAQREGVRAAMVPGSLSVTMLAQVLTDWAAPAGRLRKLEVNFRRLAEPDDPLLCRGVVIDKEVVDGEGHVRIDVAIDNQRTNDSPTVGTAVVILPMRS